MFSVPRGPTHTQTRCRRCATEFRLRVRGALASDPEKRRRQALRCLYFAIWCGVRRPAVPSIYSSRPAPSRPVHCPACQSNPAVEAHNHVGPRPAGDRCQWPIRTAHRRIGRWP
ncbi:hypothetical protein C2E23DRAFT_816700 [Lenzites betulinus]|nr:hypothetical protein C2E23DRAFT_816700 [Lenzites betulinus]